MLVQALARAQLKVSLVPANWVLQFERALIQGSENYTAVAAGQKVESTAPSAVSTGVESDWDFQGNCISCGFSRANL